MKVREQVASATISQRRRGIWLVNVADHAGDFDVWDAFGTVREAKRYIRDTREEWDWTWERTEYGWFATAFTDVEREEPEW